VRVIETIAALGKELDAARAAGRTVGFVPTMGFLHDGHAALMRRARAECDVSVVSIFVNPLQFGANEDFGAYPRDLERDSAVASDAGVDVVFTPSVDEMYPDGVPMRTSVHVDVPGVTDVMEGASRPGHFDGVATVVAKLFAVVGPCRAYFGEKDFQQLQVIRQIHRDLALPGEIVGCPTVRDDHGLALSSRNVHLSREERARASALPRAIAAVCAAAARGETDARQLEVAGLAQLDTAGVTVDYLALVDSSSLEPLQSLRRGARLLMAASVGGTRLIDNAAIEPPEFEAAQGDIGQESMVATRSCR
jgi:pantoate--beta-alanine ligase